jgi:uncharacterized membrane protein SpoIIM required for sporulation
VDLDAFVAAHRAEWGRLEALVRRAPRLSGAEADELVALYQRAATHLSMVRSAAPDPALVGRLSSLVARGRAAVTGSYRSLWRTVGIFFTRQFPAALYLSRRWWISTGLVFLLVSVVLGIWVAGSPEVRASIVPPEHVEELTRPGGQFETYYSSAPASSFAARVWTNNAFVAASCLLFGALLGLPVLYALWGNAVNVAIAGGLMGAAGRLDVFFGLITPHGLLELTGVFVAAGTGLALGWTIIDPGPRARAEAFAAMGRSAVGMATGLVVLFFVAGVIEAFVTPSPLPTWARISIGAVAEAAFLAYVFVIGRRAAISGETGDIASAARGDLAPTAA